MTHGTLSSQYLFSRGMVAVLISQFLSALADNALLFAAIALLKSQGAPAWQTPLLQEFFVVAFVLLAPFVGPFADTWPKGRVMLIANGIKLLGAASMWLGFNPLLAYGMVGLGAAAYSPAKYGILGELVGADKLVQANSLMEGSTIVAILLGAVAGGFLADKAASSALAIIVLVYLLAAVSNLFIPRLSSAHPHGQFLPLALIRDFWSDLQRLIVHPDSRFSLIGTCVFWGAGSTLRFLLVAWVPVALAISDNSTPANLSGVVAIGIATGAVAAARFVNLRNVNRALLGGVLIGPLIMIFAHLDSLVATVLFLLLIGASGGFYVVPLNALLQERGHETVGAGQAVAVQNFFENIVMLLMIGCYVLMSKAGVDVVHSASAFGSLVFVCISLLMMSRLKCLQK